MRDKKGINEDSQLADNRQELCLALASSLLHAVRRQQPTEKIEQEIATFPSEQLRKALSNDALRKTFWINMYNACYQLLWQKMPKAGTRIYSVRALHIAGFRMSLDDIEHGLLRRWLWKYGLGYIPMPRAKALVGFALEERDYRIHFALNCGAKSCPPIREYQHQLIDAQLNLATQSFMQAETRLDEVNKVIATSRLLLWFHGDFGGTSGIRRLLADILKQPIEGYKLKYKKYDWSEQLMHFVD